MGRRRKKESLVETLMFLPWWIGVGLGMWAFIGLRWMLPSMLPPLFKGMAPLMPIFGWVALGIFGVPGLISLVRTTLSSSGKASSFTPTVSAKSFSARDGMRVEPGMHLPSSHLNTADLRLQQTAESAQNITCKTDSWTVDALRELEWKRFELLCAKYYEAVGFKSETLRCGPDGGIDVKLYRIDPTKPIAVVQCKAWNSTAVGIKEVRELLGVMAHEKVERGIFVTTSTYTKDAQSFGRANRIQLLDGAAFIEKIHSLSKDKQGDLLKFAFAGDYATPTCASCGIKMVRREGKRSAFWGCLNYPKCRSTFVMK